MGDRCCLEMTLRGTDLPRFAAFVGAQPGEEWWNALDTADHPDLVTVQLYEANYGLLDERTAAAKAGIPFHGTHGAGGEYSGHAFASIDGEMAEAPINEWGELIMAVDEDLNPLDDIEDLRAYVSRLRAVKKFFTTPAVPAEGPDVPPPPGEIP